jgi:hypothetical protein
MPAVCSKLYVDARSRFLQYSAKHTPEHVKHETGFSARTLEYLWDKYSWCLPNRKRRPQDREMYFYFVWKWMHMYPTWEQSPSVLWTAELVTKKGCGISKATLYGTVLSYLAALAVHIDEVDWKARLNEYNHVEHLQTRFTTIVDTAPAFCQESANSSMTFQPKYSDNCFKLQVDSEFLLDMTVCRLEFPWSGILCSTLDFTGACPRTIWFGAGQDTTILSSHGS